MLRFVSPCYRPRYIAVAYLVTDPAPACWASDPPFCRSLLALSSWCCGGTLCVLSFGPATLLFAAAWLALSSCNQSGAAKAPCVLRFALPRYRPRYRSLHSHCIPRCAALHYTPDSTCQKMLSPLQTCVTRTSVTDLRNKIRAGSRVTDP